MKINIISPHGYCNGVKYAINILDKVIKNKTYRRPIYLLGNLIHNKALMNTYKEMGIIIIDGVKTRYDLLDEIESGTVIFSAHGVSPRVYEKAKLKGLDIIDATCPNVLVIHKKIKEYISNGYEVLYIGTKKHPECEGVIEISSKIHLISSKDDVENFKLTSDKIYITNQTTLSIFDIEEIYNSLKEKFPSAIIDNKICLATTKRQEALLNQGNSKLCIVVGDKTSSNSKKLVQVSETKSNIKSYLVETKDDLNMSWFDGIDEISITSGASTPESITNDVIEAIKKGNI